MAVYERMMGELDGSGKHYSAQISEIDLTDPEDVRVTMPEESGDVPAHFGEDHFLDRYERYQAHIAEWRQQYPRLAAVDLRYDQQVVLKVAPGVDDQQIAATAEGAAKASETKKPTARTAEKTRAAGKAGRNKSAHAGGDPSRKAAVRTETAAQKAREARDRKRLELARRTRFDVDRHRKTHTATAAWGHQ